eukprot:CAMPEP_0174856220 /NCGR_PEP_ID=MMETSP1114-20130205/35353_1 /TAXON_ID=312471 /ORGANISM="Neobodo designis, Strain CCAP 1951/1" /LENGTH=414 /DNA_ID=CAMNT_0016091005 /DNA_START=24 /DNA_END=1264 /DNA_ORIENTATION=+
MISSAADESKATAGIVVSDSCLGTGAFGAVYLGLDTTTGAQVAVKEIALEHETESDSLPTRILNEIAIMRSAKHPNVVKYIGARIGHSSRTGRVVQVVMELVAGGSLGALIRRVGALSENVAAMYIRDVVAGLIYLHDTLGIAHRDVKTDNVLVSPDGVCKLSDYGTCKAIATESGRGSELLTTCVGSPNFMAPEVAHGDTYGRAADIWSLGCVVVDMLNGSPPDYGAGNPMALMYRLASDDAAVPQLNPHASDSAKDFVAQCCSRSPALRPKASQLASHSWLHPHVKERSQKKAPTERTPATSDGMAFFSSTENARESQPASAVSCQACDVGIALFTCDECRKLAQHFNFCPECWRQVHAATRAASHTKRPLLFGRRTSEGEATKAKPLGLMLAKGTFVDDFLDGQERCPVCG